MGVGYRTADGVRGIYLCKLLYNNKILKHSRYNIMMLNVEIINVPVISITTLIEVSMEGNNFVYTYYVNDYADGMVLLQAWDINDTKNRILQYTRQSLYDEDFSKFVKALKKAENKFCLCV
jgi:hypothetical protein